MVVFSVTCAPQRLRGLLARYCLEVRAGLFVGRLSARMRQRLWQSLREGATGKTSAVVAWTTPTAQGYALRSFGPSVRRLVRMDGLYLIVTGEPTDPDSGNPPAVLLGAEPGNSAVGPPLSSVPSRDDL